MGQYYKAVSLDRKEYVAPFGAKLMEHSWVNNHTLIKIDQLLSPGNPWHKTRIVWAGDYADKELFTEDPERNLYDMASDEFLNITDFPNTDGPRPIYIVNHTKNLYFDLRDIPDISGEDSKGWKIHPLSILLYFDLRDIPDISGEDSKGWKIHPLSILTSSGNGRGGGDYNDDEDESVGSWAGDVISSEYEEPVDMEKYTHFFMTDY